MLSVRRDSRSLLHSSLLGKAKERSGGAASYKQHYRVAGGDNAVEGTFGMISNCPRKTNSRGGNDKSKTRTLLAQSAAALVRRPGVNNILSAYKTYREALQTGSLGLSPQQAFKLEKLTWLIPTEGEERDGDLETCTLCYDSKKKRCACGRGWCC